MVSAIAEAIFLCGDIDLTGSHACGRIRQRLAL